VVSVAYVGCYQCHFITTKKPLSCQFYNWVTVVHTNLPYLWIILLQLTANPWSWRCRRVLPKCLGMTVMQKRDANGLGGWICVLLMNWLPCACLKLALGDFFKNLQSENTVKTRCPEFAEQTRRLPRMRCSHFALSHFSSPWKWIARWNPYETKHKYWHFQVSISPTMVEISQINFTMTLEIFSPLKSPRIQT
jgi:hypothetical protein